MPSWTNDDGSSCFPEELEEPKKFVTDEEAEADKFWKQKLKDKTANAKTVIQIKQKELQLEQWLLQLELAAAQVDLLEAEITELKLRG